MESREEKGHRGSQQESAGDYWWLSHYHCVKNVARNLDLVVSGALSLLLV